MSKGTYTVVRTVEMVLTVRADTEEEARDKSNAALQKQWRATEILGPVHYIKHN